MFIINPALPLRSITAFILISLWAVKVSSFVAQLRSEFTLISPASSPSAAVSMVTLLTARLLSKVSAPILESVLSPVPSSIVKSVGSISHSPVLPVSDLVVTSVSASIFTFLPLVSIKPPSPASGAEASSFPLIFASPP